MKNEAFLMNLYIRLKNFSKHDFDKFISNAEMQYYNLDKSLEYIENNINNSKWNDDIRNSLDESFENMKALKDKCKKYNTDVIIPLSNEFELLQDNLKRYFEKNTEKIDDLEMIDSLFKQVSNNIDMIFQNPQIIQSMFDSYYLNNNNINIIYLNMARDYLQNSIESKINDYSNIINENNYKYIFIDRSTKLNTMENVREKIINIIKEDRLKGNTNLLNNSKDSIREECYKSIDRINELLKYGYISTPFISAYEAKAIKRSIGNIKLKEKERTTTVTREINDEVDTVSDVLGASAIASASALLGVSEKIDTVLDDDIGAAKRTIINTEEDVDDEQEDEKKGGSAIHFINVTESDAILIESNNRYGLIDASSSEQENTVLSYLRSNNVTHLDFIIASHHHWDHVSGMPAVINSEMVDNTTTLIYKKGIKDDSTNGEVAFNIAKDLRYTDIATGVDPLTFYNQMVNAMNAKGGIMLETTSHSVDKMAKLGAAYVNVGDIWKSYINFKFEKFDIKIYNLPIYTFTDNGKKYYSDNSNSLVTLITTANGQRILLSGDLDLRDDYEAYYGNLFGKIDVVKANHHGYTYSNSYSYIKLVRPTYFIIPNSKAASQDHIHGLYTYLKKLGTRVYFAHEGAINGAVKVCCDGVISVIGTEAAFTPEDGWHPWSNYSKNPTAFWKKWVYIENGEFLKGWKKVSWKKTENWYYFDEDGFSVTGWHHLKDEKGDKVNWYFFGDKSDSEKQGVMYSNTWIEDKGNWYRLGNDGAMFESAWVEDKGKWYHVDAEGAMQSNQWIKEDGKAYYLDEDGVMLKNTVKKFEDETYKFDSNGVGTRIY